MRLTSGPGRFELPIPAGHATPVLPVWYHLPELGIARQRLLVVLHGTSRAARSSRDNWIAPAEEHGFLVVVPEFERQHFADPDYAYGRLWSPQPPHARIDWAASHGAILDALFDCVNRTLGGGLADFTLYGHSAGAAFAHRYAAFAPVDRVRQAIFANSGWYTLPDFDLPLPFGIRAAGLSEGRLKAFLGKPVTVLVGDLDRVGPYPGWWPEGCERQGRNRFERSQTFFEAARRMAGQLGVPFGWQWRSVPGVAHENAKMIAPAAHLVAEAWS